MAPSATANNSQRNAARGPTGTGISSPSTCCCQVRWARSIDHQARLFPASPRRWFAVGGLRLRLDHADSPIGEP
jgi:hypothetical protein